MTLAASAGVAAEVRDAAVNLVHLLAPPLRDPRIQRIKRVQTTGDFGTTQIDGERKLHAPRAKNIRDAADLRDETVFENAGGGIHVVNRAAVDANRSQQSGVLAGAGQIAADVSIGEEDGRPAVAAFDVAVEVVPLIHPADRSEGLLHFVDVRETFRARDLAEQCKHAIENAAVRDGGNNQTFRSVDLCSLQPIAVGSKVLRRMQQRGKCAQFRQLCQNDGMIGRRAAADAQCPA